jgi:hypothetical protein
MKLIHMEDNKALTEVKKCRSSIYWVIIVLLATAVAVLSYMLTEQKKATELKIEEVIKTVTEKEQVKAELNQMLLQYDSLKTDNDTMNIKLEEQQVYIKTLITNLNSSNYKKRSLEKEVSTLRNVMKSYVYQIDSLNTSNEMLRVENAEVKAQYRRVKQVKESLEEQKTTLEEQVNLASTLQAEEILIEVLKKRGRTTRYANKVEKINVCFKVWENAIANSGDLTLYMRIARPDELVLAHSEDNLFEYEGKEIVYSAKRTFNYNNVTMNACIYYENLEELLPGTYHVDVFAEGKLIGSSSFALK